MSSMDAILKFAALPDETIKELTAKSAAMADAATVLANDYAKMYGNRNRVSVAETIKFLVNRANGYRAASDASYWTKPAETPDLSQYLTEPAETEPATETAPEPTPEPEPEPETGRRSRRG